MSVPAILAQGVSKTFGRVTALRDVTLSVAPGEFVAVVGPNGSGKSTLLRLLATLARPSAGQIRVEGLDPREQADDVRRRIGLVAHDPLLYGGLTVTENLALYAALYRLPDAARRIDEALDLLALRVHAHRLVRTLSRGTVQRAAITRALLHAPRILLLDEPYTGLDPQGADALTDLVQTLHRQGTTIVMTTHALESAAATGRVVVLAEGRVAAVLEGLDAAALRDRYRRIAAGGGS